MKSVAGLLRRKGQNANQAIETALIDLSGRSAKRRVDSDCRGKVKKRSISCGTGNTHNPKPRYPVSYLRNLH